MSFCYIGLNFLSITHFFNALLRCTRGLLHLLDQHHPKPKLLAHLFNLIAEFEHPNAKTMSDEVVPFHAPAARNSIDLRHKRSMGQQIDVLISSGHSCHAACQRIGILTLHFHRWKTLVMKVLDVTSMDDFVPYSTNGKACKIHPGHPSSLLVIRQQLKAFAASICERGIQLTNRMMAQEACRLIPSFQEKTA